MGINVPVPRLYATNSLKRQCGNCLQALFSKNICFPEIKCRLKDSPEVQMSEPLQGAFELDRPILFGYFDPRRIDVSHQHMTGGDSNTVKVKSSGEDPRATGGLVSNLPHPWANETKQHTHLASNNGLDIGNVLVPHQQNSRYRDECLVAKLMLSISHGGLNQVEPAFHAGYVLWTVAAIHLHVL